MYQNPDAGSPKKQNFFLKPNKTSRRSSSDLDNKNKVTKKLSSNPIKFHGAEPKTTYGKMVSKQFKVKVMRKIKD